MSFSAELQKMFEPQPNRADRKMKSEIIFTSERRSQLVAEMKQRIVEAGYSADMAQFLSNQLGYYLILSFEREVAKVVASVSQENSGFIHHDQLHSGAELLLFKGAENDSKLDDLLRDICRDIEALIEPFFKEKTVR